MMRALVLVVITALAATAARAYRPPSRVLLTRAMERQIERGTKTLRVELETQLYEGTGAPRGPSVVERLMFQAPASARREIIDARGTRVDVRDGDKSLTKTPGQPDKGTRAPIDLLHDLVTTAPPLDEIKAVERLLKDIKGLNINPEVVSFARFDGRVAYLIGGKPWDEGQAQLWLDKDTLLIVRVVMVLPGDKPKKTDVRYLGWGSGVGGHWFPQSIEVWSDDKLVRRSITKGVERNIAFDATSFQIW